MSSTEKGTGPAAQVLGTRTFKQPASQRKKQIASSRRGGRLPLRRGAGPATISTCNRLDSWFCSASQ